MNKLPGEKTIKEEVRSLYNTFIFDLPVKLKKVTDVQILKELKIMAQFNGKISYIKLAEARAEELNVVLD